MRKKKILFMFNMFHTAPGGEEDKLQTFREKGGNQ